MAAPLTYDSPHVQCTAELRPDRTVAISGRVPNAARYARVEIVAPCPIDRRAAYSGSGLPFPSLAVALEGTPNYARVPPDADGAFSVAFKYPNAYLSEDACEKVPPSAFVVLTPAAPSGGAPSGGAPSAPIVVRLAMPDDLPVRTLTERREKCALGPTFYAAKAELIGVRGAEATMRALAAVKVHRGLA